MEISANSFDFDDLFPGSPEAGYFFSKYWKSFVKSIRTLNNFNVVSSSNLSTMDQNN